MSPGWKTALWWGGGLLAGGGVVYAGYRYLLPRIGQGQAPAAPTIASAVSTETSRTTGTLAVAATTNVVAAAGGPKVTARWYHYYYKGGVQYPRLIATTPAVGSELAFTYGVTTKAGKIIDNVEPGQHYTFGVQVCVGGQCSPIVKHQVSIPAYRAA